MIAKEFESFLLQYLDNYLIDESSLALVIDSHNVDHVTLLLSSSGYARVPVMTKDKHYVGTISLSDIFTYQRDHRLTDFELSQMDIANVVNKSLETVTEAADLTEVMHKLVDNPFLPVLNQGGVFKGIITRKSILKAVNALLHNFTDYYKLEEKDHD